MLDRRLTASLPLLGGLLPSELWDDERAIRRALLGVLEKENALVTFFEVFFIALDARLNVLSISLVFTSKDSGSATYIRFSASALQMVLATCRHSIFSQSAFGSSSDVIWKLSSTLACSVGGLTSKAKALWQSSVSLMSNTFLICERGIR